MSVGSYFENKSEHGMLTLQLSSSDKQRFTRFGTLAPKAFAAAHRRAINKTLRWMRTHIARAIGQQERIAQSAVRQRLRAYPVNSNGQGKLWFGINAIEASRAGRARQTRTGVSVAGRRYEGAFYKKVYGDKPDIWIRTASKHFKASDYPETASGGGGNGWLYEDGNDSRFPLAKAKLSLEGVRPHFDAWARRANQRLLEILEQELNYEMQKMLKGA
ncbi:hypothetical protein [Pseudomonas huaxiensis]|uniref:hypothetical protein n=1 Tax=Pseudomonas huaxiensis TaxID=2213017 RepID=UPI000DA69925|nr:hypothetical protein [Pseudomonas huaxiensis]